MDGQLRGGTVVAVGIFLRGDAAGTYIGGAGEFVGDVRHVFVRAVRLRQGVDRWLSGLRDCCTAGKLQVLRLRLLR